MIFEALQQAAHVMRQVACHRSKVYSLQFRLAIGVPLCLGGSSRPLRGTLLSRQFHGIPVTHPEKSKEHTFYM